jgi:hypothetical protein
MTGWKMESKAALLFLFMLVAPGVWAQGPPYQIDDPVPVDYGHNEAYIFGSADGTPVEMDSTGPAFEFNWGAIPSIQLHAIVSLAPSCHRTIQPICPVAQVRASSA